MTPAIAEAMRQLERAHDEHAEALVVHHDVDTALEHMVAEPTVWHLPGRHRR